jgi:hypothetical protein
MVTELQKLQRAKTIMDMLAEGTDPVTGNELPEDTLLNNVKLSRCFFYVADVLGQIIENGGTIGKKIGNTAGKKSRVILIDTEKAMNFPVSRTPLRVMEFLKGVSEASGSGSSIPAALVTNWLEEIGLLEKKQLPNGKFKRAPTIQGEQLGILCEDRTGPAGPYEATLYNAEAQRFILDHLPVLVDKWNREHSGVPVADFAENR